MNILKHNYAQRQVPDNCRDNNFLRASSLLLILALFSWFSVSGCGGVAGKNTTPQGNGQLSARPASVAFGNVTVGSSSTQAVSFSNTGNVNLTVSLGGATGPGFSISGLTFPLTLPPGQSSAFNVQFAPTATGSASGSVSLVSDAPNSPSTIALSGTGVQPQLSVTPPSVSFGNVLVGSTGVQNFTLTNSGGASLTIAQGNFTGAGLSISGLTFPLTLAAGQSSTLSVQFAPTATGSVSGSLSLVSNAPNSPSTIALSGAGVQPQLSVVPPSVSFGNVLVGSTGVQNLTLTNSGSANLTIAQGSFTVAGFSISGLSFPLTLPPGQSSTFSVQFAPTTTGSASGGISLVSDAPNSPSTIALSGTGVQPQLSVVPPSASFGNVLVGSTGVQNLTLTNSGGASLTIAQGNFTGAGLSISGLTFPLTLAAGQSSTLSVQFAPTATGSVSGSVSLVSDAPNSPSTIALSGTGVQPQLSITPASVSFGNVLVGSTGVQNLTLTNSGSANLTIAQASFTGAGFSISAPTFPLTLAAGQSSTLSVQFAPTATSSVSGSISLVSDAPNSPSTIALSGTGVQPQLSVAPPSVSFGNVLVGSTGVQNLTLTNSGSASLTIAQGTFTGAGFSISGLTFPLTLPPGQSSTLSVHFAPTATSSVSGSISLVSDAAISPTTISLAGSGTQPASNQLIPNPSNINFGNVTATTTNTQGVVLTNTSNAAVSVSQVTVSGTGFSITGLNLPLTLAAGQSSTFNVQFAPTATGSASGSISLVSDAPNSPSTIALSGTGVQPQLSVTPPSVSFGNVLVGSTGVQNLTLTNSGSASLTIAQGTFTGAGFSISGLTFPLTLAAGQSSTLSVQFAPTATGSVSGSVSLVSNAPNSPSTIALSGTGVQPQLSVTPPSVTFGNVLVGSTGVQNITLTNSGSANLTVAQGSVTGAGGFSISGLTFPVTLPPGQSSTFSVQFAPTATGSVSGSVSLINNAPNSPNTIALSGTGVQPQLSVTPPSVSFGNVLVGSTGVQNLTLTNSGSANLTIAQGTVTGTGYSISGPTFPLTLAAGQSSTLSVQFAPTATGSASGSVSLVSDAPNSPSTIALSGTGVQPQLSVVPPSVSFGNVLVGSTAVQNLTLTNSGGANLTIAQDPVTGAGFSISGLTFPLTVAAGQSSTLSVQFAPTATSSASGSISLVSNAANSPSTIALSGTGVQPQLSVTPPSVSFGNAVVGTTNTQTITLTNPGTANLTISQATVSEQSFTMTGLNIPLILGAGQTTSFNVAYVPSSAGSVTGSLSLVSDAPNSPTTLALSGTGVAATLQLTTSPTSLSFGNVTVGSSTQTVTLTNSGNSSVSISQVQVSGPGFSTSGLTPPMTLLAGQSTNFIVAFTPAGGGSVTGSVSVVSNAANSPAIINLSGVGVHLVTLNWDPSTLVVVGYNIYRGTQSGGPYTQLNSSPLSVTAYTDSTVQAGQAYFYVATAVDLNNVESMLSNEISATIPTP